MSNKKILDFASGGIVSGGNTISGHLDAPEFITPESLLNGLFWAYAHCSGTSKPMGIISFPEATEDIEFEEVTNQLPPGT